MSPKVKENKIDQVCDFLPKYESLISKDTAEMQVEKLVLTDLMHSNQLTETSNHFNGIHPWSASLLRNRIAAPNLPPQINAEQRFSELYQSKLDEETERLSQIYANLVRLRYLPRSNVQKTRAVEQLKDEVNRVIRDEPYRMEELP